MIKTKHISSDLSMDVFMSLNVLKNNSIIIGLVDADLLDNGTRHPNLALLKIAGYLYDNNVSFELIEDDHVDISKFYRIYLSKVFSFTKLPVFYEQANSEELKKFVLGGTGFYANEPNVIKYKQARIIDMTRLSNDEYLNSLINFSGGPKRNGIDTSRQKPFYNLYDKYIERKINEGKKKSFYKDYLRYSIGFLTRGCIRHCPFCVNKLEKAVMPYSKLEWFLDNEKDEKGRLKRPYIYLWDDNFLAASPTIWKPLLQELIDTKRPFQFRQGLDERIIAESPNGEEIAEMLSRCKYHGDYIFAFDNWKDREKIEKALKIWKRYNKKETKFYLFCGFKLNPNDDKKLYTDIWEIFQRIKILMQYGCLGYVMRHENYHNHELSNIYVQIARWCNQPAFYKKMSFWEFCYRNQTFWEEQTLGRKVIALKSYDEFMVDYNNGYYNSIKICLPLRTVIAFIERFAEHKEEILEMFNYKLSNLVQPSLWENVN